MPDQRIGILIETTDKSKSVLEGIGAAGTTALNAVAAAGKKTGIVLKTVGMAATFLNQGLELAKKRKLLQNWSRRTLTALGMAARGGKH